MHILLIHQAFAAIDEPGGTRHHEFARLLAELGHKTSIIASPVSYLTGRTASHPKKEIELDEKIHIYRTYTYPALHKSFFHRVISFLSFMVSSLIKSLQIRNVDLVWGTSPPIFQAFTAWLVSRLKRVPFLLEIRDLWPAFAIEVGVLRNGLLINLSRRLERFLYRHADQIMVNSPGFIAHIEEKGGRNIQVIPNGSDISLFQAREIDKIRTDLHWNNHFVILYAGAHGMSNDLSVVIRAAKMLEEFKDIQFVLLGDGKEKNNLIHFARELNTTNISFYNPIPKKDIALYMQAADACIAILKPIDLYKTTYPNKVFDYMAAAKPILLAIDGVIREVVQKAKCGIFCKPGDPQAIAHAAQALYKNPEWAFTLGQNGRKFLIENYDRRKIVLEFADMIEKMTVRQ